MHGRLRRQDGFIREVIWLFVVIAVIAVAILDGMALFRVHQSVAGDATQAANEARNQYSQSINLAMAKIAAQQYLSQSGDQLLAFSSDTSADGTIEFTVTARKHTNTYAFKYLRYLGLKKWVNTMTTPTATRTSQ